MIQSPTATVRLALEPIASAPQLKVARITLARPPLNILNISTIYELSRALHDAEADGSVAAIVIQSEGKAFSAGVDVADHTPDKVGEMLRAFHGVFRLLAATSRVTIAAVRGACLGGGCELATFCDFVIATEDAQFGFPEIKLGCFPPIAAITLPALIGSQRALDLILTGRSIGAGEALAIALVGSVVGADRLDEAVNKKLAELFANSAAVLRITKAATRAAAQRDFEQRLNDVEQRYFDSLMRTEDAVEGIRAFLEKRPPKWKHR